jgi:outer membrane protein TolC
MATARAIGVWPSWEILTEAELLNEEMEEIDRHITLSDAVHEAIEANLDLAAKDKSVLVGMQRIRQARSKLFPHLDVSATGIVIDKDRARASFGSQAERSLSSSAAMSQVIYSESALANVDIQRHLYRSVKNEREQLRLDIALEAALAYFNLLKAKTYERIQKENLELTKSNFETARRREAIGISGRSEVYRWESQIATSRQAVIEAEANRRLAETDLNRILHRPLEERFIIEETGLNDPILITSGGRMDKYTNNPWTFRVFRDFLVEEGIQNSFQLKVIDAAIAAQNRTLVMAKRAFWVPTIALKGNLTEMIAEDGAGTESGSGAGMPSTDDTDWSLALNLSFPLYSGGSKRAARKKAEEELNRLRLEREAVKERLEQRIRSSLHYIGISHPNIRLSRDAAEAARKNLDLVTDAYSRGLVSIIELLDAQNAALVADQMAANAAYDFLIDLMKSQRAIGRMDFFTTQKEREDFLKKLDDYFKQRGITLPNE